MRSLQGIVVLTVWLLLATTSWSVPAEEKHQQGRKKALSEKEHFEGSQHNAEYDHEAFLGAELAKTFSDLSPSEAKRRLRIIVGKIDTNTDGQVTEEELITWVRLVSRRRVYDDRDVHWDHHVKEGEKYISWDAYEERGYGGVKDRNVIHDHNRNLTFNEVIARSKRRYDVADSNSDGLLDKDEFTDFLYPHGVPLMQHLVVDESFQDIDKNRDGKISVDEYMEDMARSYSDEDQSWKQLELGNFKTQWDKNKDDYLNREELEAWLYPSNDDPWVNEAQHLIYHADLNKDQLLSSAEIMDQMDLFVGSQATEHGDFFVRHDEF